MAKKTKVREITIVDKAGKFNTFFKRLTGDEDDFDLEGLAALRRLLSNERAKLLYTIKAKRPGSIYELAKIVKRDFKSVSTDIKLLERFGFLDMLAEKTGNRERLKPIVVADTVIITIKI